MKKIILILNIISLCSLLATAQKTISKKDFESLVDFANCNYIMAFIERNDVDKLYYNDTYLKKVKPELAKASLDNFATIPNYQKISELLSNNAPALKLAETNIRKKEKFDSIQTDEMLIQALKVTKWNNIDLIPTAEIVLDEIYKKFKIDRGFSAQEIVQEQTIQTSTQVEQLQTKFEEFQQENENLNNDKTISELQRSLKNFKIIVLGVFILLFVLLIVFFFYLKEYIRKYKEKQVLESRRTVKNSVLKVVKPYNLTEEDINIIAKKVLEQYSKIEKENQPKSTIKVTEPIETTKPVSKFLKGKSGRLFNRTESTADNSFFKLLNENDETAQFEFFGNEAEAIAKRIFSEDISIIISGNYQNARSIITDKPGKIKRVGEQWEVIEPIQIKLI